MLKFQSITSLNKCINEPISDKPSRTDPSEAMTVQQILSNYINIYNKYPTAPSDFGEYDGDDVEPEPNNKDLAYISDSLDTINKLSENVKDKNQLEVEKSETSSNNQKEQNESNEINSSSNSRTDIVFKEPAEN